MSQSSLDLVHFIPELALTKRALFHVQQMQVILEPTLVLFALKEMSRVQKIAKVQITKFANYAHVFSLVYRDFVVPCLYFHKPFD